jgi:hypothetical protein
MKRAMTRRSRPENAAANGPADLPMSRFFDLADLSAAGSRVEIAATAEECRLLAAWADLTAVHAFTAEVDLRKLTPTRFVYAAALAAEIEQRCVVSLEPVFNRITKTFQRELHYAPSRVPPEAGGALTLAAGDDEAPETIAELRINLAGPLLEEFTLEIDPYPRKPGVAFVPPADAGGGGAENPFVVLEKLKKGG